jgi:hypothetical protein
LNLNIIASVRHYTELGWALVTIPAGSKAPTALGWQQPERALRQPDDAERYYTANPTHNVGLLHAASGTCAIDIDHLEWSRMAFAAMGVDIDAILAKAPRIIGRPGRGKAIFRAHRDDLKTHKIAWPNPDGRGSTVVFEFRACGSQDVLPPSIHPDTQEPYQWDGPSYADLPMLPEPLQIMWEQWDKFRVQLLDACPWKTKPQLQAPLRKRIQSEAISVIDAYNAAHAMAQLLPQFGYRQTAKDRFLSPNSKSGLAGVILFEDGTAYSHHGSDPFDSAHSFDCFDLYAHCEHAGNVREAVKAAAAYLNITTDPANAYAPEDAEWIAHGGHVANNIIPSRRAAPPDNPLASIPEHLLSVPGILQDVVNYYNTTAARAQPQFAVQSALAFGSVVMGRRWMTDQRNYSSLYFLNVAVSSAGKEHAKTTIEKLLETAGLERLIGPAGYASASGVISSLIDQPCHIAVIDELGRVLQSAKAQGNHHKSDAQTIMMEAFGRQDSILRGHGMSKFGLRKQDAKELDRFVRNPSLTLLTMTTPSTLFDGISSQSVLDGFLGRFIIVESPIGRQVSQMRRMIQPTDRLLEWAKACATAKAGNLDADSHETPPSPVLVNFSAECADLIMRFDAEMIEAMNSHDRLGLDAMFGRTKEIAMRLGLIVAVSRGESEVSADSLRWAIDYARFYAFRAVDGLKRKMADGIFEKTCKQVYERIETSGLKGISEPELAAAIRGFKGLEPLKRKAVMDTLVADYGIECRNTTEGKRGRPRLAWFAP